MNEATKVQVRVEAAASLAYTNKLKQDYAYFLDNIVADTEDTKRAFDMFAMRHLRVDTSNAGCSSESDRSSISSQIKQSGGFELLDSIILEKRKELTQGILEAHKKMVIQPYFVTLLSQFTSRLRCGFCETPNETLIPRN